MLAFTATVHKLGINPCVDVPQEIVDALLREAGKRSAPVQVKGTLNGRVSFATSVVRYRGAHRLYLNTQMRRQAGAGAGDTVRIALAYDPDPRMPPVPRALSEALNRNERAKARWRLLPASRRKEILAYLDSLKSEAGMARNVAKVVRMLSE